jgi:hypothetical protein
MVILIVRSFNRHRGHVTILSFHKHSIAAMCKPYNTLDYKELLGVSMCQRIQLDE